MIAIDVTMVDANGDPFTSIDLATINNDHYAELIEFLNSCIDDSLVLNTVIPFPLDHQPGEPYVTRYYAINTAKATAFQERFMSVTAPFSIKQFWMANGFDIQSIIQTQIVFEDEPADQLTDLVDSNSNLMWGTTMPYVG